MIISCGTVDTQKVLHLNSTWSGKPMIHLLLPWEIYWHSTVINNGRGIPTGHKGESSPSVWKYTCASSCTYVLLSTYHHDNPLNNSKLQNKGTSSCMLKNKWLHKWWMRGWRTKKVFYTASNSYSFSYVTLCSHPCVCLHIEKVQTLT